MKRVAVFNTQMGIGDAVSHCFPLCKVLKNEGNHVEFWQLNGWTPVVLSFSLPYIDHREFFVFEITPLVENFILLNTKEIARFKKLIDSVDEIYLFSHLDIKTMNAFIEGGAGEGNRNKIVDIRHTLYAELSDSNLYDPEKWFKSIGREFKQEYMDFDLQWFKSYCEDFKCNKDTVLLNCESARPHCCYPQGKELEVQLKQRGLEVIKFDCNKDIRTNLFLIQQVRYILTVATSTIYLAKAIKKDRGMYLISHSERDYTKFLRVKQIYGKSPDEIATLFYSAVSNYELI